MKNQLQIRLRELFAEHAKGVSKLTELDTQRTTIMESLFRIGGAIQVLEEELAKEASMKVGSTAESDQEMDQYLVDESATVPSAP